MNVVLFQRLERFTVDRRNSARADKSSTHKEMFSTLAEEARSIMAAIANRDEPQMMRFETIARHAKMPVRRVKAFWYGEVKRIEAHEIERLRMLRADHARLRVQRAEHELFLARAALRSDAA